MDEHPAGAKVVLLVMVALIAGIVGYAAFVGQLSQVQFPIGGLIVVGAVAWRLWGRKDSA